MHICCSARWKQVAVAQLVDLHIYYRTTGFLASYQVNIHTYPVVGCILIIIIELDGILEIDGYFVGGGGGRGGKPGEGRYLVYILG